MAAAIKAINAKIRSNKVLDYVFSTRMFINLSLSLGLQWTVCLLSIGVISMPHLEIKDDLLEDAPCYAIAFFFCFVNVFTSADSLLRPDFWGPASNFGIPIAAVMDIQKDPEM
jgi:small nuclear ribonucleoprotein B and B'